MLYSGALCGKFKSAHYRHDGCYIEEHFVGRAGVIILDTMGVIYGAPWGKFNSAQYRHDGCYTEVYSGGRAGVFIIATVDVT